MCERIRASAPRLEPAEIERVRAFFAPPPYEQLARCQIVSAPGQRCSAAFLAWYRHNTRAAQGAGLPRGVRVAEEARRSARRHDRCADGRAGRSRRSRYSFGQMRVTHDQNLVLAEVRAGSTCCRRWTRHWCRLGLATPNIGTLTDMICCPGLDFCSLANAGSIGIAKQIHERFDDFDYLYDLGRNPDQDVRLHERLRPPPRRAHRHPRRR